MCKKFNNNAFGNVLCFAKPQSLTETRNEKHQQPQHMSKPCLCACLSLPPSLCLCLSCAAHLPPAGACFCFCLDRHAEFMVLKHAKVQLESNRELGRIESAKHTHTHSCTYTHTSAYDTCVCTPFCKKLRAQSPPRVGLTHNNSWLGLEAESAPATTCQTLPAHTAVCVSVRLCVFECVCVGVINLWSATTCCQSIAIAD